MSKVTKLFGATKIEREEENCIYTWMVSNLNFSSEAKIAYVDSPDFFINNKGWFLRLTPVCQHPYCFYLSLHKIDLNDTNNYNYQFSFTVSNEQNKKFIKSSLGSNGLINGTGN